MKKFTFLTTVLVVFSGHRSTTAGAPYSIDWSRQFGTSGDEIGDAVAVDPSGNVFAVGYSYGDLNGEVNNGATDAYLTKLDASGSIVWTRAIGTSTYEFGVDVAVDAAGNAYVAGQTDGNLAGSSGSHDGFVRKIDPNGATLWTSQFGTTTNDYAGSLSLDNVGNIYVTGTSLGNMDGQINSGSQDAFLRKLDSNGNLEWCRLLGTATTDISESVSVDPISGDVYFAGWTGGNLGGQTNSGSYDMYLTKYDSLGSLQWARLLGSPASDQGFAVQVDGAGSIYLAGNTLGNLDGQTNSGGLDAVLAKYDASGSRQWTRLLGTTSDEYVNDIAIDGVTGAVFMTGYTYGNLGSPNQGTVTADAFLTKWDPSGLQEWTQQFGTTETDLGSGVITDLSGSVYLTGWTDGNLFLPNDGGYDAFLIKFTPEPTSAALLLIAWLAISNRRGRVNSRSHRRRKCA